MESYSTMRKKEIFLFATTWMNPESTMFNEISKTEKDKCCMRSLRCGISHDKLREAEIGWCLPGFGR